MPRFLHLADVHLGYDKYDNPERTKDFYWALNDALQRYAIAPQVDFVVIAGDLFEYRNVLPATLNQAQDCLRLLKEADIPVIAIEGNHDHRPYGTKTSWLRYLADWGWLMLLEPEEDAAVEEVYQPWTPETGRGGYVDLDCGVRVLGSRWYGSAAPQMIETLAAAMAHLPAGPSHQVMLFHHGLQGQVSRYAGAIEPQALLPLKQAGVDYLALGHIHKNYSWDNWVFNPGAVEANSIAEGQDQTPRGVYLVELNGQGVEANLKRDYRQRPLLRLTLEAQKQWTQAELEQQLLAVVQQAQAKTQSAIVELRVTGQVGFNRLDLNVREWRDRLHQESQALIFLLKYDVVGTEYESVITGSGDELPDRLEIETKVFADLLAANVLYSEQADSLARGLIDLKERILGGQPEADLYAFAKTLLEQAAQEQNRTPDSDP